MCVCVCVCAQLTFPDKSRDLSEDGEYPFKAAASVHSMRNLLTAPDTHDIDTCTVYTVCYL